MKHIQTLWKTKGKYAESELIAGVTEAIMP